MKMKLTRDKFDEWCGYAETGLETIRRQQLSLVQEFKSKILNRKWWEKYCSQDWRDNNLLFAYKNYEKEVYDTCLIFTIMAASNPEEIILNEKEVMAIVKWSVNFKRDKS